MSDNLGSSVLRTLDPSDKSWDNIVFKDFTPPLSSDWTGITQISSLKSQDASRANLPSGWVQVGKTVQTSDSVTEEASALSGQVIASTDYTLDSFKLISKGDANIAIVNGWSVKVQQTASSDENNLITLDSVVSSATGKTDFVFLEVWRELVDSTDAIYPNGNAGANSALTNNLTYAATGLEHSQRVQIKYRVRTQISSSNSGIVLSANPEGFGSEVKVLGGNVAGSFTNYTFTNQASNGDAGLWRSGTGSDIDKASLNTVDGYVYAIPMFAVYRRADSVGFSEDRIDSTSIEKADALISDRPDDKYLDVVYKDDIIDLRHKITPNGQSLKSLADKTFHKAIAGTLSTKRGLVSNGSGFVEVPGGDLLLKGEELGDGSASVPQFGAFSGTGHKARHYANGVGSTGINHIINIPHSGAWVAGETGSVSIITSEPASLISVDGIYSTTSNTNISAGVTGAFNSGSYDYVIPTGSALIGTSDAVNLQYTSANTAGNNGFLDVPDTLLEVRNEVTNAIIPTADKDVPIRGAANTVSDFIRYKGGEYTETFDFGVDIVLYRTLDTSTSINLTFAGSKLYDHDIVGIKSIRRSDGASNYGTHQAFAYTRTIGANTEYAVSAITSTNESSDEVEIVIHASTKFFKTSKQGRGVTDIYEIVEVTATEETAGNWFIDTVDKPIIAVGATSLGTDSAAAGTPYAFIERIASPGSEEKVAVTAPTTLQVPALGSSGYVDGLVLPTKLKITVTAAPSAQTGDTIKVPVLVHSYVESTDSFVFYYHTKGYQGSHPSTSLNGSIIGESAAVMTTSGSGSITNYTYGTADASYNAIFTSGSRTVTAVSGDWSSSVAAGDHISNTTDPSYRYVISSVDSATQITLNEIYKGTSSTISGDAFLVERDDIPKDGVSNIIDRMPSYSSEDYLGESVVINSLASTLDVIPLARRQDPLNSESMDISVGSEGVVVRGRNGFLLTLGDNDSFKLKEKTPDISYAALTTSGTYKKVYQGYIFNKNETGRVYLLIISTESNSTSSNSSLTSLNKNDSVDIFEIVGRPLIKNG